MTRNGSTEQSPCSYGFAGRLTAAFPSQVIIDVTEVCNLECIHCPHTEFKHSAHYGARHLDPMLNTRMVDEIRNNGAGLTQYIRYSSEGEPLVHPKGYEMIEYAVRHSGVFVTLTTNGTIMNERRTKRLLDSGVHMIDISIDALSEETYSQVRVKGDLTVTRANVINLLDWIRKSGAPTKVVVSFIEQPQNSHEVQGFRDFWVGQGVDSVVVRRLHSAAGAVAQVARNLRKEHGGQARRPCVYPWERVVLNPRGYLAFCPADWTLGSSIVDYRENTVAQVWQSAFYQKLRAAHLSNDYSAHAFCGQCPDWQQTRWPGQGDGYADLVKEMMRPESRDA